MRFLLNYLVCMTFFVTYTVYLEYRTDLLNVTLLLLYKDPDPGKKILLYIFHGLAVVYASPAWFAMLYAPPHPHQRQYVLHQR